MCAMCRLFMWYSGTMQQHWRETDRLVQNRAIGWECLGVSMQALSIIWSSVVTGSYLSFLFIGNLEEFTRNLSVTVSFSKVNDLTLNINTYSSGRFSDFSQIYSTISRASSPCHLKVFFPTTQITVD